MALKGVIVAAGYGTRFLPVSRAIPKEMLPLVDRPALDFIVEEMVQAGVQDILVITSRRKRVLDDWFDTDQELLAAFAGDKDDRRRALLRPPAANVVFARQARMGGSGDALRLARSFVGSDPVVVAFPDDLFGEPNCTAQLVAAHRETGCSVLSAHELLEGDVSRYGVLDVEGSGVVRRVRGMVEKPAPGTEPSKVISLGRYLYAPGFLDVLDAHFARHAGGEFHPAGATCELAAQGRVVARIVDAERRDTGAPLGYAMAFIEEALSRPDLGPELRRWLATRLG